MPAVFFTFDNFRPLVQHLVGQLNRFDRDHQEQFSILFFPVKEKDNRMLSRAFERALRESDALFQAQEHFFLVLPRTGREGALIVLKGVEELLGEYVDEAIVTYPEDGETAEALLDKLVNLVKSWCKIDLHFPDIQP